MDELLPYLFELALMRHKLEVGTILAKPKAKNRKSYIKVVKFTKTNISFVAVVKGQRPFLIEDDIKFFRSTIESLNTGELIKFKTPPFNWKKYL